MNFMQDRLTIAELNGINLRRGKHATRKHGVSAMEAAAWMAGERHSDRPKCVCPTIAAFLREWNDALPDKDRDRLLKPLLPKVLGTRSTREVARRRSLLVLDWFVRVFTPTWLALIPSLEQHATALRSLAEIVDDDTASDAIRALEAANSAVHSVYVPTDRDLAVDSAEFLAVADSGAILAACSAAVGSARGTSFSAAFVAAALAARSAEVSEIAPIVTSLQQSASELVLRMVAVTD